MTFLKTIATAYLWGASVWLHPGPSEGARILAIAPIPARSHWNFMRGILHALTDCGHRVTVFTPFPEGDRENYTEVDTSGWVEHVINLDISTAWAELVGPAVITRFVHDLSRNTCVVMSEHDALMRVIEEATTAKNDGTAGFDVVFVEFLASECVAFVAAALGLPLVYVLPPPLLSFDERAVLGHAANPAAVSHLLADHAVPRTFLDRLTNFAVTAYSACALRHRARSASAADPRPFDVPAPVKPSLVFTNAHYITDAARPLQSIVVPVGGIHLSPPKTVPDDILQFLDNSPQGVILFSLGSIVKISTLPDHIHEAVIKTLGQFPQRVLLKYEDNELEDRPENVMTKKWIPQRDVLMHPNVKLFISHGGISGMYEAVDAGVPVLGFPVFFDQPRNLKNLVDAGMAISLDISTVSKDTFISSVTELINNEKYSKNAKIASDLFKDRPMTPVQTVNYWTNYVIRHKGAPHLKSRALELTWYQHFLLDVMVVLLVLVALTVYTTIIISRNVYRYCVLKMLTSSYSKLNSK